MTSLVKVSKGSVWVHEEHSDRQIKDPAISQFVAAARPGNFCIFEKPDSKPKKKLGDKKKRDGREKRQKGKVKLERRKRKQIKDERKKE